LVAFQLKATRIELFSLKTAPMRAFHLTWMAFFVCFFAWFACAPLMPVIKGDFGLTKDQIANINIAAVFVTIFVRLIIGPLCDKYGPRKAYTGLLLVGAMPVLGVATAQSYESFLFFRLLIGAIGASFVITQYHTSVMFAPNVVGTANATAAGWGNAGGGVTQSVMPLILAALLFLGVEKGLGWRVALLLPGALMLVMAVLYWRFTQDSPAGNFADLRAAGALPDSPKRAGWKSFQSACGNYRVWMLFVVYAASFGVELMIHNVAASYYVDRFGLSLSAAGLAAASFGIMAVALRPVGGWWSDRIAARFGIDGRTGLLAALLVGEGLALIAWAGTSSVAWSIPALLLFAAFTHAACGATFGVVPFIDRKALGSVAGLVGAGGNVGAVIAGFLMKLTASTEQCLLILGLFVAGSSVCALAVRFSAVHKADEARLYQQAVAARAGD
jgi:NNP family nitrate/nitrite transporter-like MFS transporter